MRTAIRSQTLLKAAACYETSDGLESLATKASLIYSSNRKKTMDVSNLNIFPHKSVPISRCGDKEDDSLQASWCPCLTWHTRFATQRRRRAVTLSSSEFKQDFFLIEWGSHSEWLRRRWRTKLSKPSICSLTYWATELQLSFSLFYQVLSNNRWYGIYLPLLLVPNTLLLR